MLQSLCNFLEISYITTKQFLMSAQGTFFKELFWGGKYQQILPFCIMKKLILEVSCERNRFRYGNLCKYLPNFLNLAALLCSIDFNE